MIKAVIFDLDGTIGNTLPLCVAAFRKAIEPLANKNLTDSEIMATFGPSEEGTINSLIPERYEQALADYLKHYRQMHNICPAPFDGVVEILHWLRSKGIVVGLVTGKGHMSCAITLPKFGIADCFDMVVPGSPKGMIKFEGITSILDKFDLKPSQALYVGDSVSDVVVSHQLGVAVVGAAWAPTTNVEELRASGPDEIFVTVADFEAYLRRVIKQ